MVEKKDDPSEINFFNAADLKKHFALKRNHPAPPSNCRVSVESVEEWYSKDITDENDKKWMDSKVREWQGMTRTEKNKMMDKIPGQQNRPTKGPKNKESSTEKTKTRKKPGRKPKASREITAEKEESVESDDGEENTKARIGSRRIKATGKEKATGRGKFSGRKRKAEEVQVPPQSFDEDESEDEETIDDKETPSKKLITNEREAVPVKQDIEPDNMSWWQKTRAIFTSLFGGVKKMYTSD